MGLVVNHSKDFSDLGREQQKPLDGLSVHSQLGSVPEFSRLRFGVGVYGSVFLVSS